MNTVPVEKTPVVVLGLDPGSEESAYLFWDGVMVLDKGKVKNEDLKKLLQKDFGYELLAIEWMESFGMPVGQEVFITCRWIGIFETVYPGPLVYVTRKQVKIHHCHSLKARDSNVRQALIDRFGKPGRKKFPGPTYGISKDMWSAFALATCAYDEYIAGDTPIPGRG